MQGSPRSKVSKLTAFAGSWIGARYIYREMFFPFFFSIAVVTFVLLTNFLIKSIDRLLGKGLSFLVIIEFIYLNMAWIVAMSIPMAVLVASLMAYGRLAEDNEITAMRSSGISFSSILVPGIIFGTLVAIFMVFFHNDVLPHANYKAKMLYRDIYRKRPDLNIEPGYFMDDIPNYSIYVKEKDGDLLKQVTIYNKDPDETQTTIYADSGYIDVQGTKVRLTLMHGEIHELDLKDLAEYRRNHFEKYLITIAVDDLLLERSSTVRRGDREMTIAMMREKVSKYQAEKVKVLEKIRKIVHDELQVESPAKYKAIKKLLSEQGQKLQQELEPNEWKVKEKRLSILASRVKGEWNLLSTYQKQINRYRVEIQKKFSIPFACIVFVLIGAPLGVMTRHGGLAGAISLSILFFVIYYVFLIGGEELADLALISPFWGMWSSNILMGVVGIYLIYVISWEQKVIDFSLLFRRSKKIENNPNERV